MTARITSSIPVRTAVACLALFGAGQSMAQTITGDLTDEIGNGSGYAGYMQNLTFASGSSAFGGAGVVVCIDPFNAFPVVPSSRSYTIANTADVITAAPTYAARTEALIDWVIDRYYTGLISNTISSYGFNQLLWELTTDYTGTLASLSTSTGAISGTGADYNSMLGSLTSAYASIPDSYRSSTFTTTFLVDNATDKEYQDMVLITAVPEPSTYLMMFAGVGALMVWRRRRAS